MTFVSALRNREPLVGNWLALGDPAVAEMSAQLAFDAVVIDIEHTPQSLETVTEMIRAVEAAGGAPESPAADTGSIVRVSENDPTEIKRVLDAGADGVMAPMVDTAAEARDLVEATRYPPEGVRGIGLGRATTYGATFPEAVRNPETAPITIAQIETETGLEHIADIAAVDGLDGLFVGPADLSAALGIVGELESDRFLDAVDRVLEAGHAEDKPVATLALGGDDVERWLDRGFDFVVAGVDVSYVWTGSERALAAFKRVVDEQSEV
ncbi:HpcH/HpaI aldolase family protein [Natrialba magadii ATCC 43099]|uniref:4-hydroxy-2-oxovalerate aldolase n=1 Tax=Natrialba magadii (strain ATCC 43099 / DSM 3394 / CCM 3739 / CIP 104546 / IAM 13178 / JCM 8861 / NBRC 102185 / NCIMB 2190 / MS3) TaxID=547559 RepID=D3T097_NATMM|nr:aldolase/citrate lyase family protein [Natrialba magadii]ADD04455.1 HpcH/HpaI aldolase family protein [Natrialba magadii ATCC 43099]ELY25850.1 4-hydroxy-2-oxovalerate aldolase [Natrialba magadii ATCC 43099]